MKSDEALCARKGVGAEFDVLKEGVVGPLAREAFWLRHSEAESRVIEGIADEKDGQPLQRRTAVEACTDELGPDPLLLP